MTDPDPAGILTALSADAASGGASTLVLKTLLMIVLILINGFFSCSEIAVLSLNDKRIDKLAEEGSKKAKKVKKLTANTIKKCPKLRKIIFRFNSVKAAKKCKIGKQKKINNKKRIKVKAIIRNRKAKTRKSRAFKKAYRKRLAKSFGKKAKISVVYSKK